MILIAPEGLATAFSLELGPEAVLAWATGEYQDPYDETTTERDYFVVTRHLLVIFSVLI
jgi:hypothetical protein